LKTEGEIVKVGVIFSAFDLGPHAGHQLALKEAKAHCDYLVVGLHTDPTIDRPSKNKPIQTLPERYIQVRSSRYVDEVIPYQTEAELLELLKMVNPQVRFLGDDYRGRTDFTGFELNIPIHYCSRSHGVSPSDIRRRVHEQEEARLRLKSESVRTEK
jgi:glycerol-3-phosphate cytidylyltransferase